MFKKYNVSVAIKFFPTFVVAQRGYFTENKGVPFLSKSPNFELYTGHKHSHLRWVVCLRI